MDTTEQYIKMCEKAEFQDKCFNLTIFHEGLYNASNGDFWYLETHNQKEIWLPRIDQLIEMMGRHWLRTLESFWHYCSHPYGDEAREFNIKNIEASSMEQLWLSFYMAEKHKKWWNGEDWVVA